MSKPKVTAATIRATKVTVELLDDPQHAGRKTRAVVSRCNGLDHTRLHGRLTEAEAAAGAVFARLFEIAQGPGVKSVDFGRVVVDGGRRNYGPSHATITATERLQAIRKAVGRGSYSLLEQVAGNGLTLSAAAELARQESVGQRAAESYCAIRLKEALRDLSEFFAAKGPARAPMRAERHF